MYSPISTRFLQEIRQSGKTRTVVDLYYNGALVRSDIPISEGSVRVDRSASNRRSGSLTIPDQTLIPSIKGDLLLPYATEIAIKTGPVYSDGEELVPLGIFTLEETAWDEGDDIPQIQFFDRSKTMQRYAPAGYINVSGRQVSETLIRLLGEAVPSASLVYDSALPDPRLPGGASYDVDHWEIATQLAESVGAEIYFDVDGNLQVAPIKTIDQATSAQDADWTVDVGETGVLISAQRSINRNDTYNGVWVLGGNKSNRKRCFGSAYDTDPASTTFFGGPFGRRIKKIENSNIVDDAIARNLAEAEIKNLTGLARTVSFSSLKNPALDAGDILLFNFFDSETEIHLVESFSIDFNSGSMSADTLARFGGV